MKDETDLATDGLDIPDFCDMEQFEKMLMDWGRSTGLATVAVGRDGEYISGCHNFTVFCHGLVRKSPEGLRRCIECDRTGEGTYLCHAGLVDFASPITLEDGTYLGSIVAGQVLPEEPDEEKFRSTARELGIDEDRFIEELQKVNVRTREEIDASADLLANVVNLFVRTSFAARRSAASLSERSRIISSLGNIYFCDYYIDLDADRFVELDATDELHELTGKEGVASDLIARSCAIFAEADYLEGMRSFTDLSTLTERMGERQSITYEFICKDSGWCRATFIAVDYDAHGSVSHVIYAAQHIQDEKEHELESQRRLEQSAAEAVRANDAKSDFLSRMSHDMRTPLNGIIGMTYLTSQMDLDVRVRENLEKIDTSSKFLLGLINDILDMTKADSGNIELHPEPYPAHEFYEYFDAVIRPLCEERGQSLTLTANPPRDVIPLFDRLRINQVLFNLLSNAVKYTPEGGTVAYDARFEDRDEDGRIPVRITIADNGIGMSEQFQKVLFDPFSREARTDVSEVQGTGLGLAIAKRLVDLMGGTISVESELGKGTTFTIEMSVDSVPAESDDASDAAVQADGYGCLRDRHILLVEDHPLNQEIATALLVQKGMTVETADDGSQGVDRFMRSPVGFYDAILMDIRMPVMDGYEAARSIRALERPDAGTVPMIAMTADAFTDDVQRCLDAGMDAHVAKPVDPGELFDCLRRLLAR